MDQGSWHRRFPLSFLPRHFHFCPFHFQFFHFFTFTFTCTKWFLSSTDGSSSWRREFPLSLLSFAYSLFSIFPLSLSLGQNNFGLLQMDLAAGAVNSRYPPNFSEYWESRLTASFMELAQGSRISKYHISMISYPFIQNIWNIWK